MRGNNDMKIKAVEVIQVLVVVKAIKDGTLDGNKVAAFLLDDAIDRTVEGTPEVLEVIKEMVKEIDAGFIGGFIDKVLKRFASEKVEQPNDNPEQSGDAENVA